jgi:hypothetical protein
MSEPKLDAVTSAIRASWSKDTCDPVDVDGWSSDNPSRGQCGSTALVLGDIFGGELLLAEVHFSDGSLQGYHYWNRLPDGEEVDLTGTQFLEDEIVQPPRVVVRPPGPPRRCAEQYELLRARVFDLLQIEGATT